MTDRKWWPEDLVDEVMPPGRASPADWLHVDGDTVVIRNDRDPEWTRTIRPGDVVDFTYCDHLGSAATAAIGAARPYRSAGPTSTPPVCAIPTWSRSACPSWQA